MSSEPNCTACGGRLAGAILRDPRDQMFCASHRDELRVCRFCERGFLIGAARSNDRCAACAHAAVTRDDDAVLNYGRVLHWFRGHGLRFRAVSPPLKLRTTMPIAPNGRSMLGFTEKTFGDRFSRLPTEATLVAIENGLPRHVFSIVVAHELGHVWLVEQRAVLSNRMEEGICEWLSHAFALHCGSADAAWTARRIATNPDPVHGEGFRRFRELANDATPAALPQLLTRFARQLQS